MCKLCDNCKLNNICEIYSKHKNKIEILSCSYKELITDNAQSISESVDTVGHHRNRDMSVDLKTLYPNKAKEIIIGTCEICCTENTELEECNGCHKFICYDCACTNINNNSTYCPGCMDNDVSISI